MPFKLKQRAYNVIHVRTVSNGGDNHISDDDKEEEEGEEKLFFSKLSNVILFRNHKLGVI